MTNRLDRLEAEELIRRLPDPDDRRGVIVELTPKGRNIWQRAVGAQAAKESVRRVRPEQARAGAVERVAPPDGAFERAGCDTEGVMPRGYMEGPAAEEAERRLEELERPVEEAPEERLAVVGSTADDPERHFLGWLGEVDPDELFESGVAWGISVTRRRYN